MVSSGMLADDDMTTGLAVHTDVDEIEDISYRRPRWWFAKDRAEQAEVRVDVDNGGDEAYDPMRG